VPMMMLTSLTKSPLAFWIDRSISPCFAHVILC
jgi:hypothetical protein